MRIVVSKMAANFARFASRGITSSIRSAPRLCTREVTRISVEHTSLMRHCRALASVQGLQSSHSTNLVQIASRNFSHYTPIIVNDVSIISNNSCGSSEALEESSTECEDEATNGRKRIKPHELQRDDP